MFRECEEMLKDINCKTLRLRSLRDLAVSTSINFEERVKSSSSGDKIERLTAEIVDLENEINEIVEKYLLVYKQVEKALDEIEDVKIREMMTRKYLLGESWSKISSEIGVSRQTLYNWNREILHRFNESFDTI